MRYCKLCSGPLPLRLRVNGKWHSLRNRLYCLTCSPFKAHNTRRLTEQLTEEDRQRRRIESNRAKFRKYQRKARHQRRKTLIQMLGSRCEICGCNEDCPIIYDFHHRDPSTKKFEIASYGLLRRWDELVAEARKCVLLCCKCHRKVHAGLYKDWELQQINI